MRTVFLGTSPFAAEVLTRLAAPEHRPQLVVTRPDRPRGRGRRLAAPPVADAARALGLELLQPENVNAADTRARIAAARPDEVCVCAFGALLREPLLSEHELLNVHPSLLPRWRGAAPVERAMMAGDEQTGVCIMRMEAGLDSGPVCLADREPIRPDDTYGTLAGRLQVLAADLLIRALDERPSAVPQPEEGVTYADKIGPDDRTLDPVAPASVNDLVVRALTPHIGARAELEDGSFLGVVRAAVRDPQAAGPLRAEDGRLLLGGLELLEVQPAGGRPMDAGDYLRGRLSPPGGAGR
ncbi:MAG: methionyl-tRNA formyltransferase [Solirubrobacteraceae bacterium]|nr:methionyl-tRNA formyltransferase [Solirubrobacteraceae bacterium]